MKLALFSPFVQSSAIGRSTALVASALLAAGHEVVIVRSEAMPLLDSAHHPTSASLLHWTDSAAVDELLANAEGVVYMVGDNFAFHEGCLHWLARRPGLICLHDWFVAHLFTGWSQGRRAEAMDLLISWYGDIAAEGFFMATDSESFIARAHLATPMTEWICSKATAVILHSDNGIDRVLDSCPGPVRVVPLAYDAPGSRRTAVAPAQAVPSERWRLKVLTVGHVNANKRVAQVIEAIGSSRVLREQVLYRSCGAIEDSMAALLAARAQQAGVQLQLSGPVDGVQLEEAFREADVVSALRWPSIEGASATAIEGMLYGKPVLVTETGFYAQLPDELVFKVSPHDEVAGIRDVLERLLPDAGLRANRGAQASVWAAATFSADAYAAQLCETLADARGVASVVRFTRQFASTLQGWNATPRTLTDPCIADALAIFERA